MNVMQLHRLDKNSTNDLESSTLTINLQVTNNHFNNSRARLRVSFKCSLPKFNYESRSFFLSHRNAFGNEKAPFHQKTSNTIIRLNDGRRLLIRMNQSNLFHLKLSRNTRTNEKKNRINQIGLFDYIVPSHRYIIIIMSIERSKNQSRFFQSKGFRFNQTQKKKQEPTKTMEIKVK